MKKALIAVGVVPGLIAAAVATLFLLVDVNQFRGTIQKDLEKQLHRPVTLGNLSLSVFPLAIRVDSLSIGETAAFATGRPFATAKQISVRAQLLPLLRKDVKVDSLELLNPAIELVKNGTKWNFDDLTGQPSQGGQSAPVTLSLLKIVDGTVATSELGRPASRSAYEHVDLELTDLAPGKAFHLRAGAQLPGGKADSFLFEGTGGPTGQANMPFEGKLTLSGAPLASLSRFSGANLPINGTISGTAAVHSAGTLATVKGRFDLDNASAHGKPLGFPLTVEYDIVQDAGTEITKANSVKFTAGKVAVGARGEWNAKTSLVNAAVNMDNASLKEVIGIAQLLGMAEGVSGSGALTLDLGVHGSTKGELAYSGTGSLSGAEIETAALSKPLKVQSALLKFDRNTAGITGLVASLASATAKGSVSVANFAAPALAFDFDIDKVDVEELQKATAPPGPSSAGDSGSKAGSKPPAISGKGSVHIGSLTSQGVLLTNVRAQAVFQKGVISLTPLTAQVYGGTQAGSLIVDTAATPAAVSLTLKMDSVDSNQLLSAVTQMKNTLYGVLGANGDVRMKLGAGDPVRSLNGSLNLSLVKGKLAGMNILNEVATIGKFAGFNPLPETATNILKLAGDIALANGVATTNNLQISMDGSSVGATGTINLADQTLNLAITAILEKALSQKVGGNGIGGFMTTALSNPNGELVIPAIVTGTFAKPRFAPDGARMLQMKTKNLIPSLMNNKGGARGILDALSGRSPAGASQTDQNQPSPAPAPADGAKQQVQGLIDMFRKKK
jgi:AsmA protein